MCLKLQTGNSSKKIAKADIIVYKWLITQNFFIKPPEDGQPFKGIILYGGAPIDCEGIISTEGGKISLCTNNRFFNGAGNKKCGYINSWSFDSNVVELEDLEGNSLLESKIVTPYKRFPVTIGETYESPLEKVRTTIEKGLHSFSTLEDAKSDAMGQVIFVKCIIPEGATYYEGTFLNLISLASDKLIYKQIITV